MSRLEELKNEVAKEFGYSDFWNSTYCGTKGQLNIFDEVLKRYAKQCSQASLEKASKELSHVIENSEYDYSMDETITDPSNIILL